MLFSWPQIEWAGRLLLVLEFALFVYWVVVIGVVGFADPNTFLSSIASATHYGATFAVYAGISEIDKANRRVRAGKRVNVEVSMNNMWIAIAVVALVTDVASVMLVVRGTDSTFLQTAYWVLLVVLNSLFVGMTALDILWLLVLRASVAVQNKEHLSESVLTMMHKAVPPQAPIHHLDMTFRL